jgi:hypothetical protein
MAVHLQWLALALLQRQPQPSLQRQLSDKLPSVQPPAAGISIISSKTLDI